MSLSKPPLYTIDTQMRRPDFSRIALLGATGSIGTQAVDLVIANKDSFSIDVVCAYSKVEELAAITSKLDAAGIAPEAVHIYDDEAHKKASADAVLSSRLLPPGDEGLKIASSFDSVDTVVNAVVGAAGLMPTLIAAESGKTVALANKESLVIGGNLVQAATENGGGRIIPIDSEHSAIAQCLHGRSMSEVSSIIITASGGPFRERRAEDLLNVTIDEVLNHPTWNMGAKITVDSATLMNKGLEVIETHVLYGIDYNNIDVLIHPGSIVHSLVQFVDGSLMAQLGQPSMKVPIMYAISGEIHCSGVAEQIDLAELGSLVFEKPDYGKFKCLQLARQAGIAGGSATIMLNGANEIAVKALLAGRIGYMDIATLIEKVMEQTSAIEVESFSHAMEIDSESREIAENLIRTLK